MCKSLLIAAVLLGVVATRTFAIRDTLYINRGTFLTVKKTTFPAFSINHAPTFESHNAVVHTTQGETLDLVVINNDSRVHGFSVQGFASQITTILPQQSAELHLNITTEGIYLFYDQTNYPSNLYLGASGMIVASKSGQHSFFWNIKEHESLLSDSIMKGASFIKANYNPDYFSINGLSYPEIQNDTTAKVLGSVGDTIRIYIANTGQSMHSIHFHGFHETCLYSTSLDIRQGWIKDTWAIRSMQALILELVVDKPGRYSVHDHNLVAVSAAQTHPNGMFTIMEFK